jgi:hypothetical protein
MKLLVTIFTLTLFLTSCGDDSSGGGSGIISSTFSDSAVSNFSQTAGIAHLRKSLPQKTMDFIIPSAYAGGGNISCLSGDAISFQMDALGNTIDVDTTCSSASAIELAIRRGLLASMDGIAIKRTITDASFKNGALDFRAAGANGSFQWDTGYKVKSIEDANGDTTTGDNCYDTYTFVSSTGKLTVAPDAASSDGACLCVTTPGHADCQTDTVSFRFVDGNLELDLTNSDNYDSSLDTYEKWESCTVGVDCEV